MALPSTPPISLYDIRDEFGGQVPFSLTDYLGAADGIPTSVPISITDFLGASAGTAGPIDLVGTTKSAFTGTTNKVISLTGLTGGTGSSPSTGDVVVCIQTITSQYQSPSFYNPTGYTALGGAIGGTYYDPARPSIMVSYKVMGSTPDTSVTFVGGAQHSTSSSNVIVYVFSGVNTSDVVDYYWLMGSDILDVNPPALTTLPTNQYSLLLYCLCGSNNLTESTYYDYTNSSLDEVVASKSVTITAKNYACGGFVEWTGGYFNASAYQKGGDNDTNAASTLLVAYLNPAP